MRPLDAEQRQKRDDAAGNAHGEADIFDGCDDEEGPQYQ